VGEFLLVPAYLGSPGSTAVKRLCVCVCRVFCEIMKNVITDLSAKPPYVSFGL